MQKKLKIYVRVQSSVKIAKDVNPTCPSTHKDPTNGCVHVADYRSAVLDVYQFDCCG